MKIHIKDLLDRTKNSSLDKLSTLLLQLGHENEIKKNELELELTPNRGDCFSLLGILRDLSALVETNQEFDIYNNSIEELDINFINDVKNTCPKISFTLIEIEEIPSIYKTYLNNFFEELENKKVNFFTDISNYLSYEIGQPTHCYDYGKISKSIKLTQIDETKSFKTLTGKKIHLENNSIVFKDGEEILNLAGVMGGLSSACSKDTTKILLECAYFEPKNIIGKSLKYDLNSDAAHKFERGVDPSIHDFAVRRFIKIVEEHAKIKLLSTKIFDYKLVEDKSIKFNANKINKILGTNIEEIDCINYLSSLGFDIDINESKVVIPPHRHDIENGNDISEEIARVIGYDNIKTQKINLPEKKQSTNSEINVVKDYLVDNGFYEVINFPFVKNNHSESIKIDNPLDSNKEYLRTNLRESLENNLVFNERRQKDSVKLFEISNIYSNSNTNCERIAIIASGRIGKNYLEFSKKINEDYIKGILSFFNNANDIAVINISRDSINSKLKNSIYYCEFDFVSEHVRNNKYISKKTKSIKFKKYKKISDFPSTLRDLSFAIDKPEKYDELYNVLSNYNNEYLKESYIFDFFHNQKLNQLKVGFRFIFQSVDKTLQDSEIDLIINDIISIGLEVDSVEIPGLK